VHAHRWRELISDATLSCSFNVSADARPGRRQSALKARIDSRRYMAKNLFPKPRLITVQQWACSQATNAKAPHFAKSDFLFALYHWPHWLQIRLRGGFGPSWISISMPEAMAAMTWNASQTRWSTERILDFLLKAGQLGESINCRSNAAA